MSAGGAIVAVVVLIAIILVIYAARKFLCSIPLIGTILCRTECTPPAFTDLTLGGCWTCPQGMGRTVYPVTADNACAAPLVDEGAYCQGQWPGSQPDPDGYCWICPAGTGRTVYPVTGSAACEAPLGSRDQYCASHWSGSLSDPDGDCWTCPQGTSRTLDPVTSDTACAPAFLDRDEFCQQKYPVSSVGWQGGDPNGGCYTCPAGYNRTWDPVTSATACATSWFGSKSPATYQGPWKFPADIVGHWSVSAELPGMYTAPATRVSS
jgi:hypothetical protein